MFKLELSSACNTQHAHNRINVSKIDRWSNMIIKIKWSSCLLDSGCVCRLSSSMFRWCVWSWHWWAILIVFEGEVISSARQLCTQVNLLGNTYSKMVMPPHSFFWQESLVLFFLSSLMSLSLEVIVYDYNDVVAEGNGHYQLRANWVFYYFI